MYSVLSEITVPAITCRVRQVVKTTYRIHVNEARIIILYFLQHAATQSRFQLIMLVM
jgi:hypothetical protein